VANKYIIHGATFNGNGTSSAEATSNGGVGAWNNINILEGTAPAYGALAAGDVVFIRSKDASGNNISRTIAANTSIGSSAATGAAPIAWVLDDGAVWSGVDGALTYNCPSGFVVSAVNYNAYTSAKQWAWSFVETSNSASFKKYMGGAHITLRGLLFDFSLVSSSNGSQLNTITGSSRIENCKFKSAKRPEALIVGGNYSSLMVVNPDIELTNSAITSIIFNTIGSGASIEVIGGKVYGVGAITGATLCGAVQGSVVRITGLSFPQVMTIRSNVTNHEDGAWITGGDGLVGTRVLRAWGEIDSRTDSYYPTLSATLPTSTGTKKWSYWIRPRGATQIAPAYLNLRKVFTGAAAAKTLTLEVLVSNTITSIINAATMWAVFSYTDDTTGDLKSVSTFNALAAALATSSANWLPDPPTYGAASYSKKKLSITTPTSIKQDTVVSVTLFISTGGPNIDDSVIVCPDFPVIDV